MSRRLLACLGPPALLAAGLMLASPGFAAGGHGLKLSERSAVPGQVVMASAAGITPKAKVKIGGKRAEVVSRKRKKLAVEVPKLKPGRAKVVVRAKRGRLTGKLKIQRGFSGAVKPVPDLSSASSAEVGTAGGTVSADAADGTTYELTVPPGALASPETLTLTPLVSLAGAPGGADARAVQFAPDGLAFAKPATLRITPPELAGGRTVGLAYTGSGADLTLAPATREDGSLLVEVRHFSGGGASTVSESDFERLIAQLAAAPVTLEAAGHFFRDYRSVPESWCDISHPTCFFLLKDIHDFLITFRAQDCLDAASGSFIDLHLNVLALLLGLEADAAATGHSWPNVANCRRTLTQRMLDLTLEPARTDALGTSNPCSGVKLTSGDYDASGSIVKVECLLVVAAEAESQGFGAIGSSARAAAEEGLQKVLDDGQAKCGAKDYPGGQALLKPGLKLAAAVQILSQEFGEALLACQPKITVTPSGPTVEIDHTEDFSVTVEDPDDGAVDWSASRGQIDVNTGHFTAPHEPGTVEITATSRANPDRHGTTTVTVACPAGQVNDQGQCKTVSVSIDPTSVTLAPGAQKQFTGTVTGTSDTRMTWSASCGSVDQNGLYTAPLSGGPCTVTVASQAAPTKQAQATVTISGGQVISMTFATGGPPDFFPFCQFDEGRTGYVAAVNDTLTWRNDSSSEIDLFVFIFGGGFEFVAQNIAPGASVSHQFTTSFTYALQCFSASVDHTQTALVTVL